MAKFVIKRDGRKEPFEADKIRRTLTAAAERTNLSMERITQVVEQVSNAAIRLAEGRDEISTKELQEEILRQLDAIEPTISESWRKHRQEKSRV